MTLVVAREECHYRRMGGGVLLVGNFLSAATGAFTVGEELAIRLRELGRQGRDALQQAQAPTGRVVFTGDQGRVKLVEHVDEADIGAKCQVTGP